MEAIIPTRAEWLGQNREEALRPDIPIVDPHHHLWDRDGTRYFPPEFLADASGGHNVVASVYVDCHTGYRQDGPAHLRSVGEVEYAAGVAAECAAKPGSPQICAGIVGNTDLRRGEGVQEVLDAMVAAGQGRFRGIRQIGAWHADKTVKGTVANPPPGLLVDPDFRVGAKVLARNGLSYDAWVLHTQLMELYDLARLAPDLTIIMDHTGGAIGMGLYEGRRDQAFAEWRLAIQTLAAAPNVHAKVGGFGMRLWGFNFQDGAAPPTSDALAAAIRPYVETCIEAFGPGRCMFESNFPVDKGSFSYGTLWNAFKLIVSGCSDEEQHELFHGTAERAYRL